MNAGAREGVSEFESIIFFLDTLNYPDRHAYPLLHFGIFTFDIFTFLP